jgi:hypothetical protein
VAHQHAIADADAWSRRGSTSSALELHVADAGIGRPRARTTVAGAVIDDAGAARGVAEALGKVPPHLDATQAFMQEDERRALEAVALPRDQPPDAQAASRRSMNWSRDRWSGLVTPQV